MNSTKNKYRSVAAQQVGLGVQQRAQPRVPGCVIYSSAEMPRAAALSGIGHCSQKSSSCPELWAPAPPCSVHGCDTKGQPGPAHSLLARGGLKALSVFQAGGQPGFPVAEGCSSVRQHWGKTRFYKAVKTLML